MSMTMLEIRYIHTGSQTTPGEYCYFDSKGKIIQPDDQLKQTYGRPIAYKEGTLNLAYEAGCVRVAYFEYKQESCDPIVRLVKHVCQKNLCNEELNTQYSSERKMCWKIEKEYGDSLPCGSLNSDTFPFQSRVLPGSPSLTAAL